MWTRKISQFHRRRVLRKRVQRLRFGGGENIILRWRGGTLAELDLAWNKRRASQPFIPGIYTAPRKRMGFFVRRLKAGI
jgi:hypothetical protein